ncbi:MAG: DEAD/DEAH box helicase, partial [Gallionellaceae bacterium]|nr:DEAD/DEAH box helicase [Gallionellaceae bacterium]
MEVESRLLKALALAGLEKVAPHLFHAYKPLPDGIFGLASEAAWDNFMAAGVGALKSAGWEIRFTPEFRHHVLEVEEWQAEIDENENGWFDLDMGIVVEGQRLPLAPLLSNLFKWDARWLDAGQIALMPDTEFIELHTQDGKRIRVTAGRLKPIATTLIDLFDAIPAGKLRVAKLDAPRLAELADMQRWQFKGMAAVQELAQRLRDSQGVLPVNTPKNFVGELRDYQREGLAWLQYLRTHQLSGILADDMGLGKTAQAIAHLQLEKEGGRLDKPALIVLPTSLVFNWKNEAARFAPELSILSLHGMARKAAFTKIPKYDVVLTTYPLLWRDAEELAKHEYHLLILDEAQMVKNAQSKGAAVVRKINTRHRLCLTGTPLENHLGELWAQFDFLMPGFLADSKNFTRTWRTPIEKQGNQLRRELLYKRLKPFILRRRKEDVAKELPSKSIIVRPVELEGMQRDLYETVRSAMDDKVRQEIAAKGFQRSQIVILDALLKLRQVCCDPRLLKTRQDKKNIGSAKLALLMDMLPELVDEGRRILIFSQFTRMLALIEAELDRLKIPYLLLTGDTGDRETPVRRFQAGEVQVFLVSLKAGGVGLNLTAADTVIHYDPWWNPAVENQATDRAHRLGQDKPVFVYKLIVAGSIEERILLMQEKKALLAESVLSKDQRVDFKFGEDDLAALLAPLPD